VLEVEKWEAWQLCRGMSKSQAKIDFLKRAVLVLRNKGYKIDDPEKEKKKREYEQCYKLLSPSEILLLER